MEDQIRQRPMEESNDEGSRQSTEKSDNQRQRPTIIDQLASTTENNRKSAYLLTVGNLAFDIQYGRQHQRSNNNRQ